MGISKMGINNAIEHLRGFTESCGIENEDYDVIFNYGVFILTAKSLKTYDMLIKYIRRTELYGKEIKIRLTKDDYEMTEIDEWEEIYSKMHKHRQEVD